MKLFNIHNSQASQTKPHWLLALSLSLMLITQTAHADFRKALEAYQKRDGDTLLKEVKDAVDRKNDDGLMLFLMATNMDAATSDYDEATKQSKSTLRAILPPPKWDALRDLLVQATNNSSVDAQYFLLTNSVFKTELYRKYLSKISANASTNDVTNTKPLTNEQYAEVEKKINDEYVKRGSRAAMLQSSDLMTKAEAGDPFSQLQLGLKYLNFVDYSGYGCEQESKEPICQTKNETRGYDWLKKSAKNYELNGDAFVGMFADSMCDLFQNEAKFNNKSGLHQAYLWCLMGVNSGGTASHRLLGKMHESGKLKIAAPELDAAWSNGDKRNKMLYLSELKELPNWIIETRNAIAKENAPIFSYSFKGDMPYALDVYNNGQLHVRFNSVNWQDFSSANKVLLTTVSQSHVKTFVGELKKIGFYKWQLSNPLPAGCDNFCPPPQEFNVVFRNATKSQRVYFGAYISHLLQDPSSIKSKQIAKIAFLAERFFPTQLLRCDLGNSKSYQKMCLQRDADWTKLANYGEIK